MMLQGHGYVKNVKQLILSRDLEKKETSIKENIVRGFDGIEDLESIKESSIDWTCKSELERNY